MKECFYSIRMSTSAPDPGSVLKARYNKSLHWEAPQCFSYHKQLPPSKMSFTVMETTLWYSMTQRLMADEEMNKLKVEQEYT